MQWVTWPLFLFFDMPNNLNIDTCSTKIPQHVAIIMDGNGRWAKERGKPRVEGHYQGAKQIEKVLSAARDCGVKYITLYAFSSENWNRPKEEIKMLFKYFDEFFDKNYRSFMEKDVKIRVMGDISRLPDSTRERLLNIIEKTKENKRFIFNICLNYGGRQEIVRATQRIALDVKNNQLKIEDINVDTFKDYLYSNGLPEVDLMIRTSGEVRLSNFLLFQLAYAELIFTPHYWPDFTKERLHECLKEYESRDRRFGSIK